MNLLSAICIFWPGLFFLALRDDVERKDVGISGGTGRNRGPAAAVAAGAEKGSAAIEMREDVERRRGRFLYIVELVIVFDVKVAVDILSTIKRGCCCRRIGDVLRFRRVCFWGFNANSVRHENLILME